MITPFRYGINHSQDQCPKTTKEKEYMKTVPYALAVGSLMYVMLCTKPDICYSVGIVSMYRSNPGREYWTAVKHIMSRPYCDVVNPGVPLTIVNLRKLVCFIS